jgi:hypothetical protein
VTVSEPFGSPEGVIIVNLTSMRPTSDTTVILSVGDHTFIKHETVVNYADARIFEVDNLRMRIQQRDFEPRSAFEPGLVKKLQQGLLNSSRTPRDIKKAFVESCGE